MHPSVVSMVCLEYIPEEAESAGEQQEYSEGVEMKIAKEMLSTDGKYKSVIVLRDDGLYEAGWQYCDLG